MKKTGLILVLVIVLGGAWLIFVSQPEISDEGVSETSEANEVEAEQAPAVDDLAVEEQEEPIVEEEDIVAGDGQTTVVRYSANDGFVPAQISISAGDTVVFENIGAEHMWPASNEHPTHTNYPNTKNSKCFLGGNFEVIQFDSCGDVATGKSWSFTFNEVGEWGYHDHRNPSKSGEIIVR